MESIRHTFSLLGLYQFLLEGRAEQGRAYKVYHIRKDVRSLINAVEVAVDSEEANQDVWESALLELAGHGFKTVAKELMGTSMNFDRLHGILETLDTVGLPAIDFDEHGEMYVLANVYGNKPARVGLISGFVDMRIHKSDDGKETPVDVVNGTCRLSPCALVAIAGNGDEIMVSEWEYMYSAKAREIMRTCRVRAAHDMNLKELDQQDSLEFYNTPGNAGRHFEPGTGSRVLSTVVSWMLQSDSHFNKILSDEWERIQPDLTGGGYAFVPKVKHYLIKEQGKVLIGPAKVRKNIETVAWARRKRMPIGNQSANSQGKQWCVPTTRLDDGTMVDDATASRPFAFAANWARAYLIGHQQRLCDKRGRNVSYIQLATSKHRKHEHFTRPYLTAWVTPGTIKGKPAPMQGATSEGCAISRVKMHYKRYYKQRFTGQVAVTRDMTPAQQEKCKPFLTFGKGGVPVKLAVIGIPTKDGWAPARVRKNGYDTKYFVVTALNYSKDLEGYITVEVEFFEVHPVVKVIFDNGQYKQMILHHNPLFVQEHDRADYIGFFGPVEMCYPQYRTADGRVIMAEVILEHSASRKEYPMEYQGLLQLLLWHKSGYKKFRDLTESDQFIVPDDIQECKQLMDELPQMMADAGLPVEVSGDMAGAINNAFVKDEDGNEVPIDKPVYFMVLNGFAVHEINKAKASGVPVTNQLSTILASCVVDGKDAALRVLFNLLDQAKGKVNGKGKTIVEDNGIDDWGLEMDLPGRGATIVNRNVLTELFKTLVTQHPNDDEVNDYVEHMYAQWRRPIDPLNKGMFRDFEYEEFYEESWLAQEGGFYIDLHPDMTSDDFSPVYMHEHEKGWYRFSHRFVWVPGKKVRDKIARGDSTDGKIWFHKYLAAIDGLLATRWIWENAKARFGQGNKFPFNQHMGRYYDRMMDSIAMLTQDREGLIGSIINPKIAGPRLGGLYARGLPVFHALYEACGVDKDQPGRMFITERVSKLTGVKDTVLFARQPVDGAATAKVTVVRGKLAKFLEIMTCGQAMYVDNAACVIIGMDFDGDKTACQTITDKEAANELHEIIYKTKYKDFADKAMKYQWPTEWSSMKGLAPTSVMPNSWEDDVWDLQYEAYQGCAYADEMIGFWKSSQNKSSIHAINRAIQGDETLISLYEMINEKKNPTMLELIEFATTLTIAPFLRIGQGYIDWKKGKGPKRVDRITEMVEILFGSPMIKGLDGPFEVGSLRQALKAVEEVANGAENGRDVFNANEVLGMVMASWNMERGYNMASKVPLVAITTNRGIEKERLDKTKKLLVDIMANKRLSENTFEAHCFWGKRFWEQD